MTTSSDSFRNVTKYTGQDYRFVPTYIRPRDPRTPTVSSLDTKPKEQQGYYPITSLWTNSTNGNVWALTGIVNNLARWILISSGSSGPALMFPVPFGTSPVVPSGTGDVTLTSSGGTITITGGTNSINFDLSGGGVAIDQIAVDAFTAPGTNPVVPTATGQITVTGAQVSAGTVGTNVIRSDSLAANTYTIEIQRSTAVATSTVASNGVSHFNSTQFTVDSNAFVSTKGNTVSWVQISASQALAKNTGYFCIAPGGALALSLPSTASSTIGDLIEVTLDGATSWTITQAAGQQIQYNNLGTTVGVGGSLASTDQGNTIKMVYQATGKWNVISALGTLEVT